MNELNIALSTLTFRKEAFQAIRKHRPMYMAFIIPILFGIGNILRKDPSYTISMTSLEKLALAVVMSTAIMMVKSLILQFIVLLFGKQLNFWSIFNIGGLSYLPISLSAIGLWILNDYGSIVPDMIFGLVLRLSLILYLYSVGLLLYGLVVSKDKRQLEMEENADSMFPLDQNHRTQQSAQIPRVAALKQTSLELEKTLDRNKPTGTHDGEDLVKLLQGEEGGINVFYRPNLVSEFSKEHFPNKSLALKFAESKALEFDTIIVSDLP